MEMIVSAPFTKPAPPMPETARPAINILELTEAPQRRESNSKSPRKAKKTI
jgi:hypothetical protein